MRKQKIVKLFLTTFLLFFLCSCDPGSKISYLVINKTKKPIEIRYRFVFSQHGDTIIKHILIAPDSAKLLNTEDKLGYAKQIDQRNDSVYLFYLEIAQGRLVSNRNFKDKKYWIFKIENKLKGVYTLSVVDSLFHR